MIVPTPGVMMVPEGDVVATVVVAVDVAVGWVEVAVVVAVDGVVDATMSVNVVDVAAGEPAMETV